MKLFWITILLLSANLLNGQVAIKNVDFTQKGDEIYITYDVEGQEKTYLYVYYSMNDGATWNGPVKNVRGDVYVSNFGTKNQIIWDVTKERGWLITENLKIKIQEEDITKNTFVDSRDGQIYKWARIGNQVWMTENLNYDADSGCWCYNDNSLYCNDYGRLYNWETAKRVCPDGWHLPSDAEWEELAKFISKDMGGYGKKNDDWNGVGKHLKAEKNWENNGNGTDNYGFNGLPGGYRYSEFSRNGFVGYWWSATNSSSDKVWLRKLYYNYHGFGRTQNKKNFGFSVRCVRD